HDDAVLLHSFPTRRSSDLFGYEPGELVGRPVEVLNAPGVASPEETASAITEYLQSNSAWRGEVHAIRKDGSTLWCAVNVTTGDRSEEHTSELQSQSNLVCR